MTPRDFLSDNGNRIENNDEMSGRDFLSKPPKESFGTSAYMALPRIAGDLYNKAGKFVKEVPSYYESAKTEVPGAFKAIKEHPGHAAMQGIAGINEGINQLAQAPKGLANYGANRLNLLPQSVPNFLSKITPEDTTESINSLFEQPKYPGEKLIRGTGRNIFNIAAGTKAASALNPMNLTSKSIAKDILKTAEKNKKSYGNMYENLWNEAKNKGFDSAMYNVNIDLPTLKKFSPQKSIKGIVDFDKNPTLQNAHVAKSDLLRIQRDLNKLGTLRSAERQQLKAANDAIDSIQSNMFKDAKGVVDQNMLNRYNQIQQGYANEVIPYKNKAINKFKRNEMSAKELVDSLSKGEFSAKRGHAHPAIKYRNVFKNHPYLTGAGLGTLGKMIYDNMMGNSEPEK